MADLEKALAELYQTTVGYTQLKVKPPTDKNSHWYKALEALNGEYQVAEQYLKNTKVGYKSLRVKPPTDKNSAWYKALVELGVIGSPNNFGALIPKGLPNSPGSEIQVATSSEIKNALSSAPFGSKIKVTQPIDGNGGEFVWNRNGNVNAVTEIYGAPLKNTRFLINHGSYFRFRNITIDGGPLEGIKIEDGDYIEGLRLKLINAKRMGLSIQRSNLPPAKHFVFRDCYFSMNANPARGIGNTLDHPGYINSRIDGIGLFENIMWDGPMVRQSVQFYPHATNWLIICNSSNGQVVLGAEQGDAFPTGGNTIVGLVVKDSQGSSIDAYQQVGPGNKVYDSLWWNGGQFETNTNISYVHCEQGDPSVKAKGFIQTERYGYVPSNRTSADAGYIENFN